MVICHSENSISPTRCHCEEGISPTKQSLFVWHPLHNGAGRLLRSCKARNDKLRHCVTRMVICHSENSISPTRCHCEEGMSLTKQSLFVWHHLYSGAGRLLRPCRVRNDKLRHCVARMVICHSENSISPTKQSLNSYEKMPCSSTFRDECSRLAIPVLFETGAAQT